jgi:hypothetical protein
MGIYDHPCQIHAVVRWHPHAELTVGLVIPARIGNHRASRFVNAGPLLYMVPVAG